MGGGGEVVATFYFTVQLHLICVGRKGSFLYYQGLTTTLNSAYVIMYVCQDFVYVTSHTWANTKKNISGVITFTY